jgi:hypothetical protein
MRVIVSGMIAGDPYQGGATWAVLQYVLGLKALGHDVFLIEPITTAAIQPHGSTLGASINALYFRDVTASFGLLDRASLVHQELRATAGLSYPHVVEAVRTADVLINISGMLRLPDAFERIPRRVYLDLDPAFNQLWQSVEGIDMRFDGHTHFATVGLAIGTPDCTVPTCGRTWIRTLQPVVLSAWPDTPADPGAPWTTVGNWRGYGSIEHGGVFYGQKAHSTRALLGLPARTSARLQPAFAIHPGDAKDLEALRVNGWTVSDPSVVASTPALYQRFIRGSKAELGIAKAGYVASRCGWFSDRSVCYLASGRPVVAQETGFSRFLPTGNGLLSFTTVNEAADAIEAVDADYARHSQWARDVAERHFRADVVLGRLLAAVESDSAGTLPIPPSATAIAGCS